ncbi:CARDB domain-containing protein [Candidatus Hydrogenedentota bacterium]
MYRGYPLITILMIIAVGLFAGVSSAKQATPPVSYDMGTSESPLADGYIRVTADDKYDAGRGYGFTDTHKGFIQEMPLPNSPYQMSVQDHFRRHGDALKIDGVGDTKDMEFRVDVPPGRYRVTVSMGDLNKAMGCVSLYCNGKLVEQNLRFHHGLYRQISNVHRPWNGSMGVTGFYDRIRFTADASDGVIVLKAVKDESEYDRRLIDEKAKEMKVGKPTTKEIFEAKRKYHLKDAPYVDIGEPFVYIPLLGVEIRPYAYSRVDMIEHGTLAYVGSQSEAVAKAVTAFNEGRYGDVEKCIEETGGRYDPLAGAITYMWLAGWPAFEEEERIIPKARKLLKQVLAKDPGNAAAVEAMETLTDFDKALTLHLTRGITTSHFIGNVQACHLFQLAQPGDPLYWKARLQAARTVYMMDPVNRGDSAGATADEWMKEFIKVFPENRYARYFVKQEFDTMSGPWTMLDYSKVSEGTPEWAAQLHEVFNRMLDLSEWWIENKQRDDGSIGGGWGDDVEFVGFFGYYGFVSEGASQISLDGAAKLVNGVFELSGGVDPEVNFIWGIADTEHATEWTGDTLPMMLQIDFANPLWIERAMGSIKLMQSLWTGINKNGHRHFKTDYIGGSGIRANDTPVDGHFAWRGMKPIDRYYWYSQNPALKELMLEWAEAWLEDSMATTAGKPAGIIPQAIRYADCVPVEQGGKDWTYKFGHRYKYRMAMPLMGYKISQDPKFLEPFRLCAEQYDRMSDVPAVKKPAPGTPEAIKRAMGEAKAIWDILGSDGSKSGATVVDKNRPYESVVEMCKGSIDVFRKRWPKMTTEASATDRIGFHGISLTLKMMTGGGAASTSTIATSLTYQGVGRDIAGFVTENSLNDLTFTVYVFRDGKIDMGVRPWDLQQGWTYKVTVSTDTDHDGKPDGTDTVTEYDLTQRGKLCSFTVEGRKTHIVRIEKLKKSGSTGLLPDLAMSDRDIFYNAEQRRIFVKVHNTGSAQAGETPVILYEGSPESGKVIGKAMLTQLDWPKTFDPQTMKFGWGYSPKSKEATFTAVVDPDNIHEEIAETNNQVTRTIRFGEKKKVAVKKKKLSGGRRR